MIRVAVIGAGLSGLSAARRLAEKPSVFKFVNYECSKYIGGTWKYTEKLRNELTEYEHISPCLWTKLRTNSPLLATTIPGFRHHDESVCFKPHTKIFEYLDEFADNFDLKKNIKFNTAVVRVHPVLGKNREVKWELTNRDLKTGYETTDVFDSVMDCTGHFGEPFVPQIPGLKTFPGNIIHSDDLRDAELFRGKKVIVIGLSISSLDILADQLTDLPQEIVWSYRSNPKGLYHAFPAFFTAINRQDIIRKPFEISKIEDSKVYFQDDSSYEADAIIFGTGYKLRRSFYTPECEVKIEGKRMDPLYKFIFHAKHPSLMFIGNVFTFSYFVMCDYQVRCALEILQDPQKLPSTEEMFTDIKNTFEEQMKRFGGDPNHTMIVAGKEMFEYYDDICKVAGLEPDLENAIKLTMGANIQNALKNFETFRKFDYRRIDKDNIEIRDCETTFIKPELQIS